MDHADRLRQIADTGDVRLFPLICDDLRAAADRLEELEAKVARLEARGITDMQATIEAQAKEIARLHYWLHTIRSHAGEIDVDARTALEPQYIEDAAS